jgi:hypothetical protein
MNFLEKKDCGGLEYNEREHQTLHKKHHFSGRSSVINGGIQDEGIDFFNFFQDWAKPSFTAHLPWLGPSISFPCKAAYTTFVIQIIGLDRFCSCSLLPRAFKGVLKKD